MLATDRRRRPTPAPRGCAGVFQAHDPALPTFGVYNPLRPAERYDVCPACYGAARDMGIPLKLDRRAR
jgi:hypothetical protein